jgi:hypothetical protein
METIHLRLTYDGAGPVHWNGSADLFGVQDKAGALLPGMAQRRRQLRPAPQAPPVRHPVQRRSRSARPSRVAARPPGRPPPQGDVDRRQHRRQPPDFLDAGLNF